MECRLPKYILNMFVCCVLFQTLKTDMIPFLVGLLDRGLDAQESPAAIKAQIVKAIKAMQTSFKYGDEVKRDETHIVVHLPHC